MAYPLRLNGPYENGWPGTERVVYIHEAGEVDDMGHSKAYYCGTITHVNAIGNGFFPCHLR